MRIFAGDRVKNLMERMGMPDDEPIEHPWVTKSVENAQTKVEQRNFDIRKNLLEYDDVMNAQRKTVYALRQQLLLGIYEPEELDHEGKPSGAKRSIEAKEEIRQEIKELVGQLVGMFAETPLQLTDERGRPRAPTRDELGQATEIVDQETLQREAYHLWGVKFDLQRKRRAPLEIYDELLELVARGLTQQRERLFDVIDRVLSAMVEESCPQNRPPEDWDWAEIFKGYSEHFKRPLDKSVEELGEPEHVAKAVYEQGLAVYLEREKRFGVANMMRFFRHFYLQEIDKEWVDHLTSMEHLRDGIGLRGYGQRDPKNEYKKEGYDIFLNMMANVSSSVLVKLIEFRPDGSQAIEALEAEAEQRHQAELDMTIARHPGEEEVSPQATAGLERLREEAEQRPPVTRSAPKIGRNDPCPCGSGKKFKQCHGSVLEDESATV
jgi:preprotein translocase subunit SecA